MADAPTTLVIFAHPILERARVAPGLLAAAQAMPRVEVRDLYELYPDFTVDVEAEQAAVLRHHRLVLQFPLSWFSGPALMKEWLDQVLTVDFVYGATAAALKGRTLACAVSTGDGAAAEATDRSEHYSIEELLRPFDRTAHHCQMAWAKPFIVHGETVQTPQDVAREAARYAEYLRRGP